MFLDDYPEGHERRRMAELNFEEVKRLEGVVGRFLKFARPGEPSREPVAVRELLEKTEALAGSTARQRDVQLVVSPPAAVTRVTADGDQLVQVLLNLVLNAVEVSPAGGTVTVKGRVEDGACVLTVDDEGPGVPEDLRERVFDPFFTTRAEGTGLGLSIASQIVLAHSGALACEAADGGGGRFVVRLPLEESS
jgi:signal transduction histidine kinase